MPRGLRLLHTTICCAQKAGHLLHLAAKLPCAIGVGHEAKNDSAPKPGRAELPLYGIWVALVIGPRIGKYRDGKPPLCWRVRLGRNPDQMNRNLRSTSTARKVDRTERVPPKCLRSLRFRFWWDSLRSAHPTDYRTTLEGKPEGRPPI